MLGVIFLADLGLPLVTNETGGIQGSKPISVDCLFNFGRNSLSLICFIFSTVSCSFLLNSYSNCIPVSEKNKIKMQVKLFFNVKISILYTELNYIEKILLDES